MPTVSDSPEPTAAALPGSPRALEAPPVAPDPLRSSGNQLATFSPELLELWAASAEPVLAFTPRLGEHGRIEDFLCLHANPAAHRTFGGNGRSLAGMPLGSLLAPERLTATVEALARAVEAGQGCVLELEPDAELGALYRGNAVPYRGHFVVQLADVRPMVEAERALRQSAARFRAVEELSLDGVMICRAVRDGGERIRDFVIDYLNPSAARMIGEPLETLLGQRLLEKRPGLKDTAVFRAYCRVTELGGTEQLEVNAFSGAREGYWHLVCTPFEEGFAVRFNDITERRRAEESSRLLSDANVVLAAFTEPERMLVQLAALLVPRLGDFCTIFLVDDTGAVQRRVARHADPAKQELLEELARQAGAGENPTAWSQVLRTGEPEFFPDPEALGVRGRLGSAGDQSLLAQVSAAWWMMVPLRVGQRTIGAIGVGAAARRRQYGREDLELLAEIARRAAVAVDNATLYQLARSERIRAEEASRSKDDFLAVVSHELRTPLTAILGWVRLLRAGVVSPDKRERAMETLERNARVQAQLIEDLLDVSRIISGKLRMDVKATDAVTAVEAALEMVRPGAEAKGVELEATLPASAPLHADPGRLQQVVWNLVANAVKFTPAGGKVQLWLEPKEGGVELGVRDSGVGISGDFLPHVFERFRQADSSATRAHGGLGLGLAIVQHVVHGHGGEVKAESAGPGKGATFIVRFPEIPVGIEARPIAAPLKLERIAERVTDALAGVRVLLVEDEPDARELLQVMLERSGATVTGAESAAEALEVVERQAFDLLISDIGLPGMDGLSLLRSVRMLPSASSRVPAIALTAHTRAEDRTRALLSGFDLYVSKPVDPTELVSLAKALTG